MYEVGIPESQHAAMYEANVVGTENVLGAAKEAGVPKIVYVSTCGAFGNTHHQIVDEEYRHPGEDDGDFTSYYEQTKVEAHRLADRMIEEGLPCTIVQPGGVYGPGDTSQLFDLLDQFLKGKMPLIPFPELGLCLAHVEDTAAGIVLALDKGGTGETYVIAGPPTTMRDAVGIVASVSGRRAPKHAVPTVLMKAMTPIGPLVGKAMGQPPNLRELIRSADNVTFWATNEKAVRELGFDPRGIEEGIRQTLEEDDRFPSPAPA
jgi:nucleoside-diphosphate-sugar epimerase